MSRSSPTLQNPAHRFFEWKAEKGELQYYDKEAQERKTVKLPFEFMVLDMLSSITGFSRPDNASYYSNEVRRSDKEEFTIKLKGGTVVTTLYKNEHGVVQVPKAAKYQKILYIAHKENGEYIISRLAAPTGSVLSAWIDFNNSHRDIDERGKVIMSRGELLKGERSDYYPPKFEYVEKTTKAEDEAAVTLDKALQHYLERYFNAPKEDDDSILVDEIDDSDTKATPAQIADFERRKAQKAPLQANDFPDDSQDVYNSIAGSEEVFTDDDIPPEFR